MAGNPQQLAEQWLNSPKGEEAKKLIEQNGGNPELAFRNITINKGNSTCLSGDSTIQINDCGVYKVNCNGVEGTSTTIQLYKDGVAQPQAQSTGTSLSFSTLVQVPRNNCCCPCSSPVNIQVINTTEATFTNINIVVEKVV